MLKKAPALALALAMTAPPSLAVGPSGGTFDELHTALSTGTTRLNLRYRYEDVSMSAGPISGASISGNSSSVRTELSYETGTFNDLRAFLEFEATIAVLDRLSPGIQDPSGGSVNQLYVTYSGVDNLAIVAGRREIVLDNERFVGDRDWRQNNQAFDSLSFQYTGIENLVATYVYVTSLTTVLGVDVDQDGTHLLNASYDLQGVGKVTGYYYRIDTDAVPLISTDTMGLRFVGDVDMGDTGIDYTVEWATQDDRGRNPLSVSETYLNLGAGVSVNDIRFGVQLERMGGSTNGGRGEFTTPFADFHSQNGLADAFAPGALLSAGAGAVVGTATGTGLEDLSFKASGESGEFGWLVAFHIFDSNRKFTTPNGRRDEFGEEFDVQLTYALNDQVDLGFLYANFNGFTAYSDLALAALWMSYRIL